VFTTVEASGELLSRLRRLLGDAFDGDFSATDWEHTLGGWHVVVTDGGVVVSHAAVVPRVLEVAGRPLQTGYVEGVATVATRRREGLGSLAMAAASTVIRDEFGMGALSTGSHDFYARLGWQPWQGPTYVRHGSEVIRTAEDDDGLMVLRFGPSKDIDLTAPLSCAGRRGDDW